MAQPMERLGAILVSQAAYASCREGHRADLSSFQTQWVGAFFLLAETVATLLSDGLVVAKWTNFLESVKESFI